jgi:murein DD-endopeptidase MepM/ murein hydrolase activator NlpD
MSHHATELLPTTLRRAARAARSLRPRRLGLHSAILLTTLLLSGVGAQAASAYRNPFAGDTYTTGRTDMGVDMCLTPGEPIRAIGYGTVVGIIPNWFAGQPYIWYRLDYGADAGRYVYIAEQIKPVVHVGQQVAAGQVLARFATKGTCIETGWGTASGWTLAQRTTGYHESERTPAGVSFARFLASLGVHGPFQFTAN